MLGTRSSPKRWGLRSLGLCASLLLSTTARADPAQCLASYEKGQRLRLQSKLVDARRELLACAQEACPAALRSDCIEWLGAIRTELPTIVVKVEGQDGCDAFGGRAWLDGRDVAEVLGGRPFEIDPGVHRLQVDVAGARVDQQVVVATGSRARIVKAVVPRDVCELDRAAPRTPASEHRAIAPTTFILAGIGLAALGIGAGFSISGWSQKSSLDACRGSCLQEDYDATRRTLLVGDLTIGLGLVALATATVVHFLVR